MTNELIEIRDGRRISIKKYGCCESSNIMILLIHGAGGRGDQWKYQVEELTKHEKYFVVVPDFLGHGDSDSPRNASYDFLDMVGDMEEVYIKYRKQRNILIGHSYGTMISLWLGSQYKNEIEKMVLIGAPPLVSLAVSAVWYLPLFILRLIRPIMSKIFVDSSFHSQTNHEFIEKEKKRSDQNQMYVIKALFKGFNYDMEKKVSDFVMPVRIIHGEEDKLLPIQIPEKLVTQLPTCELFKVEMASHLVMMEQPDEVNQLIFEFLNKK